MYIANAICTHLLHRLLCRRPRCLVHNGRSAVRTASGSPDAPRDAAAPADRQRSAAWRLPRAGRDDTIAKPGEYAEVLRTLGQLLDRQGVTDVTLADLGHEWSVAWREASGARPAQRWHRMALDRLRAEAVAQRAAREQTPLLGYGEILRTLGALCDRAGLELTVITEEQGIYRLAGVSRGRTVVWRYARDEVARLVEQQRAARQRPALPP